MPRLTPTLSQPTDRNQRPAKEHSPLKRKRNAPASRQRNRPATLARAPLLLLPPPPPLLVGDRDERAGQPLVQPVQQNDGRVLPALLVALRPLTRVQLEHVATLVAVAVAVAQRWVIAI